MGLGAAIEYIQNLDRKMVLKHELDLARKLFDYLSKKKDVTIHTKHVEDMVGIISFSYKSIHPHDVAGISDSYNVCLRAGHHCAQLLMKALDVAASCRVSLYIYNNDEDLEQLFISLEHLEKIFLK